MFVNDNLSESMDVMVETIMSNYGKTKEEAIEEYTNAKMQLENSNSKSYNNKVLESMYNSGVMLELSHNAEEIMININNIKFESTLNLVFKFISYALFLVSTAPPVIAQPQPPLTPLSTSAEMSS